MSNYSSEAVGVMEALSKLSFTDDLKMYIVEREATWANFGKMTSHLYRQKLMELMDASNMTNEAKFMVFFFFSVIKNQARVLRELNNMPAETKNQPWYKPVKEFITSKVTQYVTQTVGNTKFPAVNIPSCNPGLDILVFCLITNPADLTIENVRNRTTFSQLDLDKDMQAEAKTGYANYWNNIVQGTKNETKTEEPKMREEYYNTSAQDKYKLIDHNLKEIAVPNGGYSKAVLLNYFSEMLNYKNSQSTDGKKNESSNVSNTTLK